MMNRNRPKIFLTLVAMAMATIAFTANSAHAQTVLVDEDFQGGHPNGTANPIFPGWTWSGAKSRTKATADFPGLAGNEGMQFEWDNQKGTYDIAHNWAGDDNYTLTLNASQQAWPGNPAARSMSVELLEDNGTVLWTGQADLPENAGAWNGPGIWGNADWTDDVTFSWDIDASTFGAGTAGEEIDLRLGAVDQGNRGFYFDNVSLTLADVGGPGGPAVPEPASITIWSLLGLCLAGYGYRRRKQ